MTSYLAISIDTTTIKQAGYRFESGLLAQLVQFAHTDAPTFILSDIVVRETRRQLIEIARQARDSLKGSIGRAQSSGLIAGQALGEMSAAANAMPTAEQATDARIERFVQRTGAAVLSSSAVNPATLVDMYFAMSAPFELGKRAEFPDAIALLALEAWAEVNDARILAVSQDSGWTAYCETSDRIDAVGDLDRALQLIQENADELASIAATFIHQVVDEALPNIHAAIFDQTEAALESMVAYGEGHGAFELEGEQVEFALQSVSFYGVEPLIVSHTGDALAVSFEAGLQLDATCSFSLSKYDSVDREYMDVGSTTARRNVSLRTRLLITFEGDFAGSDDRELISSIEILDPIGEVDFGEVEPDWMYEQE